MSLVVAHFLTNRVGRLVFAGLINVTQGATAVGLSMPVGGVVGFVSAAVYEPFAGRRVDHLKAAGYGTFLMGWFVLVFCSVLVVFPLD